MIDTILFRWLRTASDVDRERLALLSGTSVNYLYQIAACRREPKVGLAFRIESASRKLWAETEGRLAIITAEEIAQQCALEGL